MNPLYEMFRIDKLIKTGRRLIFAYDLGGEYVGENGEKYSRLLLLTIMGFFLG